MPLVLFCPFLCAQGANSGSNIDQLEAIVRLTKPIDSSDIYPTTDVDQSYFEYLGERDPNQLTRKAQAVVTAVFPIFGNDLVYKTNLLQIEITVAYLQKIGKFSSDQEIRNDYLTALIKRYTSGLKFKFLN